VDEPNHYGTIRQGSFSNVVKQGGGMTGDINSVAMRNRIINHMVMNFHPGNNYLTRDRLP